MKTIGLLPCLFLVSSLMSSEQVAIKSYDKLFEQCRSGQGYSLHRNNTILHFPNHQVSKSIRDLRAEQLAACLNSNAYYLKVTKLSDGSHALDLQGRLLGGGFGGALAGMATGSIFGKAVVYVGGVVVLFATQKTIGVVAGSQAEAVFAEKMQERFLPRLWEVSEVVGDVVGGLGTVVGGMIIPG